LAEIAAKDAEIDRLTFQLSEANRVLEAHKVVAASRSENMAALKADKERMEKGITDVIRYYQLIPSPSTLERNTIEVLGRLIPSSPADGDGVDAGRGIEG
jgi:hypothetical protein